MEGFVSIRKLRCRVGGQVKHEIFVSNKLIGIELPPEITNFHERSTLETSA